MRRKIRSVLEIVVEKGVPFNSMSYSCYKRKTDPSYFKIYKYYSSDEINSLLQELQSTVRD